MPSAPSIRIDGSTSGTGTTGQSRTDIVAGETVTLNDTANSSFTTIAWELWTSTGSAVTLTGANTATPTFTAVADESYLAFVTVDGIQSWSTNAVGHRVSTQGGIAVLTSGERALVPGETKQHGGWDTPIDNLLADYRAGNLGGAGASDHGNLTGLADDDHTQYLLADGTRALAGNIVVDALVTVDGRDLSVDGAKLDLVEDNADVTDATNVAAAGALMADGSANLTGNLTVTAAVTIDGRDISADGAILDAIEAGADVTDATNVAAAGALMADGSATLTGNLTVSGSITIDGRDISADGALLDAIEAGADVTDATNVNAAGAVMHSDVSESSGLLRKTASETYEANDTIGAGIGTDVTTVTDQATLAIDCSLGNVFKVTLGGNRTVGAPSNPRDGQVIQFFVIQSTGSNTLTWNAVFKWPSGTAPTLSTAASAIDIVSAVYDGTNWYATSALNFS